MTPSRSSGEKGFGRKKSMPCRVAAMAVSMLAYAVIMQVMVSGCWARKEPSKVRPSTSGS